MVIVKKDTEPESETIYSTEGDEKTSNNQIAKQLEGFKAEGKIEQSDKSKEKEEILKSIKKDVEDQILKEMEKEPVKSHELIITLDMVDTIKKSILMEIERKQDFVKRRVWVDKEHLNAKESKEADNAMDKANDEIRKELRRRGYSGKKPEKKEENPEKKTDIKQEETKEAKEIKKPEKKGPLRITDEERREKESNIVSAEKPTDNVVEERQKREKELLRLEKELNDAREGFVKMDIKKGQLWKRVANFFKTNKSVAEQWGEDLDVKSCKERYEKVLKEYQTGFIEEAKKGNITDKEIGFINEYFDKDEKLKLYDLRTEVRSESIKGTKYEWIKEQKNKFTNWYIKLPTKKKIALAIGLVLGAGATHTLGTTVAGVFAIASIGRRFLVGSAMAVGVEAGLEKRTQKRRDNKSEKIIRNRLELFKYLGYTNEEKLKKLNEILNDKVSEVSTDLQKRKLGSLFRKSSAVLAGYLVGSGALFGDISGEADFDDSEGSNLEVGGEADIPVNETTPEQIEVVPQPVDATAPIELTVEKGSSLEGTIIRHLNNHPEMIDKYSDLHGGINYDAGQIAHRMALEFAENNADEFPDGPPSLIHPGAEINIDPENINITEIGDSEGLGYMPENEIISETESQGEIVAETGDHVSIIGPDSDSIADGGTVDVEVAPEINRNIITGSLHEKFHMFSGDYDKISSIKTGSFMQLGPYHAPGAEYVVGEDYDYNEIHNLQKSIKNIYNNLSGTEKGLARKMSVEKFIKANFNKLFSK